LVAGVLAISVSQIESFETVLQKQDWNREYACFGRLESV
jgi:hypothetical protein